jgi:uncharacterized protein YecT (DUF1311 family)
MSIRHKVVFMLRPNFCSVAIAICAFNVYAAEVEVVDIKCNHEGTQQELNACAFQEYENDDKLLNERYKNVMQSFSNMKQDQLRQEQRLWLKMRDPLCKQEAKENEGGSIWPLMFYGCLSSRTKQRAEALGK